MFIVHFLVFVLVHSQCNCPTQKCDFGEQVYIYLQMKLWGNIANDKKENMTSEILDFSVIFWFSIILSDGCRAKNTPPHPPKKLLIEDLRDFGSELTEDTTLTK